VGEQGKPFEDGVGRGEGGTGGEKKTWGITKRRSEPLAPRGDKEKRTRGRKRRRQTRKFARGLERTKKKKKVGG